MNVVVDEKKLFEYSQFFDMVIQQVMNSEANILYFETDLTFLLCNIWSFKSNKVLGGR